MSGKLFSVQNNRWILIKRKIAEKVKDSDFTEIDLIVPPWTNVFVQTGGHYRYTVGHIENNDRITKTKSSYWFYRYEEYFV